MGDLAKSLDVALIIGQEGIFSMATKNRSGKRKSTKSNAGQAPHPSQWEQWGEYLKDRRNPAPLSKLLRVKTSPLTWSLPAAIIRSDTHKLLQDSYIHSRRSKGNLELLAEPLEPWLGKIANSPMDESSALECLAWAHSLPRLSEILPAGPWNSLLECLSNIAKDALSMPSIQSPLLQQYIAAELPISLAYVLPEIDTCRDDAQEALEIVAEAITECLDGEGLPHISNAALLRPLTACWTRCLTMSEALKIEFDGDARLQYEWLVRQLIRLTRPDGTQVLSASESKLEPSLLRAALSLVEDPDDAGIAAIAFTGKKAHKVKESSLPSPAAYSEWGETAILRTKWKSSRTQLTVAFNQRATPIELLVDSKLLFSGSWDFHIAVDDKPLNPTSDWEESCWYSDDDIDFLELTMPLNDGWAIERQMILCRKDDFLILADVILGPKSGRLKYRSELPLTEEVETQFADDTREALIHGKRPMCSVLPLALPEWRVDPNPDSLTLENGNLVLEQSCVGQRTFAPLFFDLDKRRQNQQLTWRQLTVAERMEIQPKDAAVGYRIQAGSENWLLYRSLAPKGNRSLLGQNFYNEFYLARIDNDGLVKVLIEID
ncbi:MAG: hypothetical protein ACI9G1_001738 [Pirellulaceae bacterium]|jgi:hypothetical protein